MAVSWAEVPAAIWTVAGATAIEICVGEATKRLAVLLIPLHFAVMVDCPTPCPVAAANFAPAKVATFSELDVQLANVLMSWVEPSLKVPTAE